MNRANALPLLLGSPYTSAKMPATMVTGAPAQTPQNSRNTSKHDQLGDKAQATVNNNKTTNVAMVKFRLPKCSLKGPQMSGPNV